MSRSDALGWLRDYPSRSQHVLVGLMTGTSADAVDAALVRLTGGGLEARHEMLAYSETAIDEPLRREVLDVAGAAELAPERLLRLDAALGERFAMAVMELLSRAHLEPSQVDAIGSHGQTVRHLPRVENGGEALSLQIGSAAILAERTGIPVVSDFRPRDAAAGGEGAPLAPLADWWLFRSAEESRVLLNLGGIANLTYLPRGAALEDLVAFDTGPGNAVLDSLVRLRTQGAVRHDEGGAAAARGSPNRAFLEELLADPFFALEPPRSTGREKFGDHYAHTLRSVGLAMGLSEDDLLATAVELAAASIARGVSGALRGGTAVVYASGGGVRNSTLMSALERRLTPILVRSLSDLGVAPEAKEALAFAFLAHQTLCGLPGNVPRATGASRAVVLGHITPGVGA